MTKTIEKVIEEVIHESGFRKKSRIIHSRNFKKILESSGLDFMIINQMVYPRSLTHYEDEEVTMLIHLQGVTLTYSYSPGLGIFPNTRDRITAYGTKADIQYVKDELDNKMKELGYY